MVNGRYIIPLLLKVQAFRICYIFYDEINILFTIVSKNVKKFLSVFVDFLIYFWKKIGLLNHFNLFPTYINYLLSRYVHCTGCLNFKCHFWNWYCEKYRYRFLKKKTNAPKCFQNVRILIQRYQLTTSADCLLEGYFRMWDSGLTGFMTEQ